MNRELLCVLSKYSAFRDEANVCRTRAFLSKNIILTRDEGNTQGHITASVMVMSKDGNKALMCRHTGLNKWVQPGGHVDKNETPMDAAIREAREETGMEVKNLELIDIDVHLIPAIIKGGKLIEAHLHYDFRYIGTVIEEKEPELSDESDELAWIETKCLHILRDDYDTGFHRLAEKTIWDFSHIYIKEA
jgi:8-oxo-dGTP pyrophosphatase MutT (NUDIX family)